MVVVPHEGHHLDLTLKLSKPARKPTTNAASTAAMNTPNTPKGSWSRACHALEQALRPGGVPATGRSRGVACFRTSCARQD